MSDTSGKFSQSNHSGLWTSRSSPGAWWYFQNLLTWITSCILQPLGSCSLYDGRPIRSRTLNGPTKIGQNFLPTDGFFKFRYLLVKSTKSPISKLRSTRFLSAFCFIRFLAWWRAVRDTPYLHYGSTLHALEHDKPCGITSSECEI